MKPNKWTTVALGDLVTTKSGGTPSRENAQFWDGNVPWFSGKDLKSLYLHDSIEHVTEAAIGRGTRLCEPDTILVLVRGMTLMKEVPIGILRCRAAFNQDVKALVPKDRAIDIRFLAFYLLTENARIRNLVTTAGHGTGRLALEALEEYPVSTPPLPEQRKIADILTTWDEALTQLDALIDAQEHRKKALMQQLLTGKKRLPGFKGKWKKVALGEVAENVADANKGRMGTASLYGVSKAEGVVPMRDHVKGESFDRCKRVETNWFAYNPMRINIGSIARWQGAETVMVSGDYVVFRCHPDKLLPAYLDHLRQSWMWQSFVTRGGNGSVRIRIYFSDLAEFTFPCPPLEEQRQIAALLDAADQQLTLLRTQRTALDQQKRGLMQRLLTGKLRVKV